MAEQAAATTGTGGMFGTNFKWDDLTKMLGGFMKKPENQRMIMEMVRPMTQRFDPRTGKMVGGVGTGMLDAGSTLINREEVGKTAAAQAQRQQLYNQQLMNMYKQMMGGQKQPAPIASMLGQKDSGSLASSAGWLDQEPRIM